MFHAPPRGRTRNFHTKIITPPDTMPATAPARVVRRQKRAASITGPKAPPKPAHAKDTIWKMELNGSHARRSPTTAMTTMVRRATSIEVFGDTFMPRTSWRMFSEKDDAAVRSCESAVDMVQARIPASTTPATRAAMTPFCARTLESSMMVRSASLVHWKSWMMPACATE